MSNRLHIPGHYYLIMPFCIICHTVEHLFLQNDNIGRKNFDRYLLSWTITRVSWSCCRIIAYAFHVLIINDLYKVAQGLHNSSVSSADVHYTGYRLQEDAQQLSYLLIIIQKCIIFIMRTTPLSAITHLHLRMPVTKTTRNGML